MAGLEDEEREDDDPRVARIMQRMRLFVGVSVAIMAAGFFLVMSVIVWRLVKQNDQAVPSAAGELIGTLPVAKGSRITGTSSDGARLFVSIEQEDGRQSIYVFDASSLAYRGRIETLQP